MVETSFEQNESKEIEYNETFVESFEEGVNCILGNEKDYDGGIFSAVVCDIDGVTVGSEDIKLGNTEIRNNLVQYPLLCYLVSPNVKEETRRAFEELAEVFDGRIVIATNRDRRVRFPWTSNRVVNEAERLTKTKGLYIPIFERMQKQVPFLARERAEKLVEYLSKALVQSDNYDSKRAIVLNSIEDKSFVVPNRETFLMYLSKMLHKEFGMGIRIENYVIR